MKRLLLCMMLLASPVFADDSSIDFLRIPKMQNIDDFIKEVKDGKHPNTKLCERCGLPWCGRVILMRSAIVLLLVTLVKAIKK